jgi:threonine dehydrogenase-like Zn-dependent dehydrogenase
MTVASWQTTGSITLMNKDIPQLKSGEILVKVAASGICGTLVFYFPYYRKKIKTLIYRY